MADKTSRPDLGDGGVVTLAETSGGAISCTLLHTMLGNGDAVTMSRVLLLMSLFLPCSTLSPRVQRRRVVTKMGMEGLDTTELLAENAAAIAAVGSKTGLGGGQ